MNSSEPEQRRARRLRLALGFLGTILGFGAFGLGKAVLLFAQTAGWLGPHHGLGPFYLWPGIGLLVGLALGVILTRMASRK